MNEDLSEDLRKEISVHYVSAIDEVLELALLPAQGAKPPARAAADAPVHGTVQ